MGREPKKYGTSLIASMGKRDDPLELLEAARDSLSREIPYNATTITWRTWEMDESDFSPMDDEEEPLEPPDFSKYRVFKMTVTWYG